MNTAAAHPIFTSITESMEINNHRGLQNPENQISINKRQENHTAVLYVLFLCGVVLVLGGFFLFGFFKKTHANVIY